MINRDRTFKSKALSTAQVKNSNMHLMCILLLDYTSTKLNRLHTLTS